MTFFVVLAFAFGMLCGLGLACCLAWPCKGKEPAGKGKAMAKAKATAAGREAAGREAALAQCYVIANTDKRKMHLRRNCQHLRYKEVNDWEICKDCKKAVMSGLG